MSVAPGQPTLAAQLSPSFCDGHKFREVEQALLWTLLHQDPHCTSSDLLAKAAQHQIWPRVTLRQINRWRAKWQLSRGKGRPLRADVSLHAEGAVICVTPRLSFVGVHLFARWLDQQDALEPVVARLKAAMSAYQRMHPDDDFALLHHRDVTLRRRFEALVLAPLLGLERLSAFDSQEHPMETLIGQSYQYTTLNQFLGQLERIDAGPSLMPILGPGQSGQLTYVDGHMIAYWSRKAMHKGKITMRGRIMAGSQAVISHDATGRAVYVAYYPPDMHLSQMILSYCEQVAVATGSDLFVIDRAVNSKAIAQAFDEVGLGLLCMLDDNEHHGLESFEATEVKTLDDGTRFYEGPWKVAREGDTRHFVIVEPPASKPLVYWGTPKVKAELEAGQWPEVYRARTELQENAFKRMIEHGALDINVGRKTILGPDRHQQRAEAKVRDSLEAARRRVEKKSHALEAKREQVAQSQAHGHGKRLEQRQRAAAELEHELSQAQQHEACLQEQVESFEAPKERADRDFRKQTIMTIRTLFLENLLGTFISALLTVVPKKVSLEQVLKLLFERSGSRIERDQEILYWVNTTGLSRANRRVLAHIVEGLNAMGLMERGKTLGVCLREVPP
jgi:flagellar biosynthesis GTPase FlhF